MASWRCRLGRRVPCYNSRRSSHPELSSDVAGMNLRMLVLHDPTKETDLPKGCVATIGNFDGIHIGHQEIIRTVVERARALSVPSVLITFQPHPLSIVAPDRVPRQILTLSQKEEIVAELG